MCKKESGGRGIPQFPCKQPSVRGGVGRTVKYTNMIINEK